MFLHVSVILFTKGVVSQHALQVISQHALQQISRPTPRGKLRGLAWGVYRPTPGGCLQAHTQGVCVCVCIPACTEADSPHGWLLPRAVRILLECILVYLIIWPGLNLKLFATSSFFFLHHIQIRAQSHFF